MMSAPSTPRTAPRAGTWEARRSTENEQEDKQIVHAKRLLDQIASHEFQRELRIGTGAPTHQRVSEKIDENCKDAGQGHPQQGPTHRLAQAHHVLGAMKDAQIECQHRQHKPVEGHPEDPVRMHGRNPEQPF